jgi:hypothetical protein
MTTISAMDPDGALKFTPWINLRDHLQETNGFPLNKNRSVESNMFPYFGFD